MKTLNLIYLIIHVHYLPLLSLHFTYNGVGRNQQFQQSVSALG